MSPSATFSLDTFSRLQQLAEPFIDTPETVVVRLLDAFEAAQGAASSGSTVSYDAASPPNLTHTKVTSVALDGQKFVPNEAYWNYLLFALVRKAGEAGKTPEDVRRIAMANAVVGKKEDSGYRFIPEAGVSIQGQDAVGAWKSIYSLATQLGVSVDVTFSWLDNPKAANPGGHGRLSVGKAK